MPARVIVAEYHNVQRIESLKDEELIKRELKAALEEAGATVFGDVYLYNFIPGITAVAIIGVPHGEYRGMSHGAFHSYPELAYARLTMDCYAHMKPRKAVNHFSDLLYSDKSIIRPTVRSLRLTLTE